MPLSDLLKRSRRNIHRVSDKKPKEPEVAVENVSPSIASIYGYLQLGTNYWSDSITRSDSNVSVVNRDCKYIKNIFRNNILRFDTDLNLGGSYEDKLDTVLFWSY